ncbi:MAG TPA: hypothetical protein PK167_06735, partial [Prolixibacteraceae bacterium]|nr:hypothetical protein [Prolixibacteraceae bacterium]
DWLRTYRTEEETYLHLIGHNTAIGDRVSQSFFFQKWPNLLFEIQYCLRGHNRMSGAALTTTARFRITITNGVKTYYLSLSGWKEQESYVEQTMQTVQFGISWNTLKIFTNPPDISGTVTVEIFRVTSTYENRGDLLIGGILVGSVKVYTEELSELTDPRETTLNFRENATQYGNDIILMPCDLPEMANASLFFANGQYVEKNGDMAPVSLYSYNGGELRTWLQIIEENQRFLHGVTRQEISGDFRGQLLSLNAIIRIPACYNREYYIREASFNVLEDVFTLKMIEIPGTAENSTWILRNGIWDDTGSWMDEETWNDADPDPNN